MKKIKEFVSPNAFSKRCFAQYDEIPYNWFRNLYLNATARNLKR